jgi:hypothetical protein
MPNVTVKTAIISPDEHYRYWLVRLWANDPVAVFVMLNPSTADAVDDDPTIRRCVDFANRWGCGGLIVVNLFAYRATSPRDLVMADIDSDVYGPDNELHQTNALNIAKKYNAPIICGWGKDGDVNEAGRKFYEQHSTDYHLQCLGVNSDGSPKHPLYLSAQTQPMDWNGYD